MAPVESIVELARALIRIPSQGGIDPPDAIVETVCAWLADRRMASQLVRDPSGSVVGVSHTIGSGPPRYCLNACLDTAPFGDTGAWSVPPTGAEIRDGWLCGRGSSDSKVAVAIFAHVASDLAAQSRSTPGSLTVLFDADEHTGGFGGVRAFLPMTPPLDGVMIGYPGLGAIAVGGRGFWRATVTVSGTSAHSGSRDPAPDNAVVKAAAAVQRLAAVPLPAESDSEFPLPPRLTVTSMAGGQGFTIVPDVCRIGIDCRLTPAFDAARAEALVRSVGADLDRSWPTRAPTRVDVEATWPAYRLAETSPVAAALRTSVRAVLGHDVPLVVVGPSNIGNFLAAHGVDATCGFGVNYRNLHAADEAVELRTIGPVYETYRNAVLNLLQR